MSEDQEGGSTGLIIGMIIGGIVVLLLVVMVVFGAGFFFMTAHRDEGFAPVAAPVAAPPMVEVAPAPPVPAPAVKGRDRLLGAWEGKTLDGDEATLEFLADGTLQTTTQPEKGDALKAKGRWEVVEEAGDRLKLRRTAADNTDSVQDLRFDGPERFVIEGKGGGAYTRKPK